MAGTRRMRGAIVWRRRSAYIGTTSSFMNILRMSAMAWRRPNGPTRFGPGRSWMRPAIRRSTQMRFGRTAPRTTPQTKAIFAAPSRAVARAGLMSGGPAPRPTGAGRPRRRDLSRARGRRRRRRRRWTAGSRRGRRNPTRGRGSRRPGLASFRTRRGPSTACRTRSSGPRGAGAPRGPCAQREATRSPCRRAARGPSRSRTCPPCPRAARRAGRGRRHPSVRCEIDRHDDKRALPSPVDRDLHGVQGLSPVRLFARVAAGDPDLGLQEVLPVELLGAEAAVVAHPEVVHRRGDAGEEALDDAVPVFDGDVAADFAAVADGTGFVEPPDALAEPEFLRRERAHGADVGRAGGEVVVQRPALVRPDERVACPLDEGQLSRLRDLTAEADAARALDAARHVGDDVRADRRAVVAGELAAGLGRARDRQAGAEGVVLQLALARLVADGAVERMVDEEELHRGVAGREGLLGRGLDDHPVAHGHRAGGLDLRHALDLDHAHAALADDGEPRVVAEVRDLDAGGTARLERVRVVRDFDDLSVDGYARHDAVLSATLFVRSSGAASAKSGWLDFAM